MLTPPRLPADVVQGLFCLVDSLLYPSAPKLGLRPSNDKRKGNGMGRDDGMCSGWWR